ncbi:MAG TPA: hypothetical protein PKV67_09740 [Hyphomonas sp.]|nr:hypothetical protein [Hyphomonas sp.]HRK66667.1 hypothetical protein [Hyphomonas sp.]
MRVQAGGFGAALSQFAFQAFEDGPVGVAIEFDDSGDGRHGVFDVFV